VALEEVVKYGKDPLAWMEWNIQGIFDTTGQDRVMGLNTAKFTSSMIENCFH